MNPKSYSQILDDVAGDQLPNDLDLAPSTLARIQKGKRFTMQPATKLVSAILLVVIAFAILFYAVPGVAAAIGRWFGYLPGVGLVRAGEIRVLAQPVSATRDGVTVTVDQVVLNQERTSLLYSVDGLPGSAMSNLPGPDQCDYRVWLRPPAGEPLLATPNGVQAWADGYQHRFDYAPLPATVNDATLVIDCLFHTRPGAAPEDWQIPLHFVPAPPDLTAFPVINIPTPTAAAPVEQAAPVESPAAAPAAPGGAPTVAAAAPAVTAAMATADPAALSLTLDRAVPLEGGYLLYATLHWEHTPYISVDLPDPAEVLHLRGGDGQPLAFEIYYDEYTHPDVDQRQTVFALQTAPLTASGPLTLAVDAVLATLPAQASFVFDPGPNPQPGQTWQTDIDVTLPGTPGEQRLHVRSVEADVSGYSFDMTSDTGILTAGLSDPDHPVVAGGGGEGIGPGNFWSRFDYAGGLPTDPITVQIGAIGLRVEQPLQVQWAPPAGSVVTPTQSAVQPGDQSTACLTAAGWKAALAASAAQPPSLPAGLPGKVLLFSPPDANSPSGEYQVVLSSLAAGSTGAAARQVFPQAHTGALSPDGTQLAYSNVDTGLSILDLASGQSTPLPGTTHGDSSPVWSPDGRQIVFNRGMGIFDLFIINRDGSGLRQLSQEAGQEWPVGWLDNGTRLLYSLPGRENVDLITQVDLASGAVQPFPVDNVAAVSPDGRRLLLMERTFGDRWLASLSDLDGANRKPLAGADLWFLSPQFSPDGQWLLASVSVGSVEDTVGALLNVGTCQVIALPGLKGSFLSWTP